MLDTEKMHSRACTLEKHSGFQQEAQVLSLVAQSRTSMGSEPSMPANSQ
jgi:hypothetical protein